MKQLKQNEVVGQLKKIIQYDLALNIPEEAIDENISLFEDGLGLDSISIVNFIVVIESKFKITFEEDKINTTTFKNLKNLSAYIKARATVLK